MHFVVGPAEIDPRFQDVILPLEIAETYWGIPAHARILDALAEEPWQQDLEIDAVRRAGKLGELYVDAEGDMRIRQPEAPTATECCLYEYGPAGFCRTAIATGTPQGRASGIGTRHWKPWRRTKDQARKAQSNPVSTRSQRSAGWLKQTSAPSWYAPSISM